MKNSSREIDNASYESGWQSDQDFADDISKLIFWFENCCVLVQMSLKCVHDGSIDNRTALVPMVSLHRIGDTHLFEPMLVQPNHTSMEHSAPMSQKATATSRLFEHALYTMQMPLMMGVCTTEAWRGNMNIKSRWPAIYNILGKILA